MAGEHHQRPARTDAPRARPVTAAVGAGVAPRARRAGAARCRRPPAAPAPCRVVADGGADGAERVGVAHLERVVAAQHHLVGSDDGEQVAQRQRGVHDGVEPQRAQQVARPGAHQGGGAAGVTVERVVPAADLVRREPAAVHERPAHVRVPVDDTAEHEVTDGDRGLGRDCRRGCRGSVATPRGRAATRTGAPAAGSRARGRRATARRRTRRRARARPGGWRSRRRPSRARRPRGAARRRRPPGRRAAGWPAPSNRLGSARTTSASASLCTRAKSAAAPGATALAARFIHGESSCTSTPLASIAAIRPGRSTSPGGTRIGSRPAIVTSTRSPPGRAVAPRRRSRPGRRGRRRGRRGRGRRR